MSNVIEPTADHVEGLEIDGIATIEPTQLKVVKFLRATLEAVIVKMKNLRMQVNQENSDQDECLKESFVSLKDAKIWLGWELARLKKETEA